MTKEIKQIGLDLDTISKAEKLTDKLFEVEGKPKYARPGSAHAIRRAIEIVSNLLEKESYVLDRSIFEEVVSQSKKKNELIGQLSQTLNSEIEINKEYSEWNKELVATIDKLNSQIVAMECSLQILANLAARIGLLQFESHRTETEVEEALSRLDDGKIAATHERIRTAIKSLVEARIKGDPTPTLDQSQFDDPLVFETKRIIDEADLTTN